MLSWIINISNKGFQTHQGIIKIVYVTIYSTQRKRPSRMLTINSDFRSTQILPEEPTIETRIEYSTMDIMIQAKLAIDKFWCVYSR